MKILVCSRSQVAKKTKENGVTHILSLLDPGVRPHHHPSFDKKNWKLVICEDEIDSNFRNAPTKENAENFLEWSSTLPSDAVLLVHCEAGISRSTAAALSILVQKNGVDKIDECAKLLLEIRPEACPNFLITKFADEILGCDGELHAAGEKIAQSKILDILKE